MFCFVYFILSILELDDFMVEAGEETATVYDWSTLPPPNAPVFGP